MTIQKGIQSGAVTHHHDQVIVPVSLRIKNIKKRTVDIPTPPDALFDLLILPSFFYIHF